MEGLLEKLALPVLFGGIVLALIAVGIYEYRHRDDEW